MVSCDAEGVAENEKGAGECTAPAPNPAVEVVPAVEVLADPKENDFTSAIG